MRVHLAGPQLFSCHLTQQPSRLEEKPFISGLRHSSTPQAGGRSMVSDGAGGGGGGRGTRRCVKCSLEAPSSLCPHQWGNVPAPPCEWLGGSP